MKTTEGLTAVVFGSLGILLGFGVAIADFGQDKYTHGLFGALGIPVWGLGASIGVVSVWALVSGIRTLRRERQK